MGGQTRTREVQTQQQQAITQPWQPAQPFLTDVLGQLQTGMSRTGLTGGEMGAIEKLKQNAAASPNYTPQLQGLIGDMFSGGQGIETFRKQLDPFASGAYVDPSSNGGLKGYLDVIANDVGGRINSMFAGAGRDLSSENIKAYGRGVSEAQAPILANQYNLERDRQLGAIRDLFSGEQTALGNRQGAVGLAAALPEFEDNPANRVLAAEGLSRNLPIQNLGMLTQLGIPIAGLGGQTDSTGTSMTVGSQRQPAGPSILGGVLGGVGLAGRLGLLGGTAAAGAGAAGAAGLSSLLPLLALSDARAKEDIKPVGRLNDGQTVYSYRYKIGGPRQLGLLAQEVERFRPDAVHNIGGVKMVDYGKATADAHA